MKAETALPLAKPNYEGYQYSRNLQVVKFLDSLKTAVSNKLAWTASEDSFYPRSTFVSAEMKGLSSNYKFLESVFYMQGAEDVLDKLYELYGDIKVDGEVPQLEINKNKKEVEEKMSKLNIRSEEHPRPEAFLNVKFLGLQKLWSFDEKYVTDIIHEVSSNMAKYQSELERGLTYEYFKILDLSGSDCAFPTESGMAAYITLRNPTVAYSKAELKSKWESVTSPRVEMSMKGVTNYKRQLRAGVISPITNKFYGAGVETSMHVAIPLKSEFAYANGQIQVTLKPSEVPEYQRELPVVVYDVLPFTTTKSLYDPKPLTKGDEFKPIKGKIPEIEVKQAIKQVLLDS